MTPEMTLRRKWLTVDEVVTYTGRSRTEVYAALQCEELPGSQRAKRGRWRVHTDDVDTWMRGGRVAS